MAKFILKELTHEEIEKELEKFLRKGKQIVILPKLPSPSGFTALDRTSRQEHGDEKTNREIDGIDLERI